jgi:rubredoxin
MMDNDIFDFMFGNGSIVRIYSLEEDGYEMDDNDKVLRRKLKTAEPNCLEGNVYTIHCHKCAECGYVWRHDPEDFPDSDTEGYIKAHLCKACGHDERWVYNGEELPTPMIGGQSERHKIGNVQSDSDPSATKRKKSEGLNHSSKRRKRENHSLGDV